MANNYKCMRDLIFSILKEGKRAVGGGGLSEHIL